MKPHLGVLINIGVCITVIISAVAEGGQTRFLYFWWEQAKEREQTTP